MTVVKPLTAGSFPLTDGEQRILALQAREPAETYFNRLLVFRIVGALDESALRTAVERVVAGHDALRATYRIDDDGEPTVTLAAETELRWDAHDLSALMPPARARRVEVLCRRSADRPFELAREMPLRVTLIRTGDDEYTLVVVVHAIVGDERSVRTIVDDLATAYNGGALAPAPRRIDSAVDTGLDYWQSTLEPLPEPLVLPGNRRTQVRRSHTTLESTSGTTDFATFAAAFATVVHRYSGSTDFLISIPADTRTDADAAVGYFGNTLLERTAVGPEQTFTQLVRAVGERHDESLAHRGVAIDRVVRALNPSRGQRRDGLEPHTVVGFEVCEAVAPKLDGLSVEVIEYGTVSAQTSLWLTVTRYPDRTCVTVVDRLDAGIAEQFAHSYVTVLANGTAAPDESVGALDLLGSGRDEVLRLARGEDVPTAPTTLIDLFERSVAAAPSAIALVDARSGASITYADLDDRANRLAHWLIRRSIGTEQIVALRMTNSVEMIVGILGVLKSGAAYLPIDPAYPDDRIAYLVADAQPDLVLDATVYDTLTAVPVDRLERVRPLHPDNLAYVLYTSGSTGRPKGVPVSHAAIAEHIEGFGAQWDVRATDRVLQSTSVSFDGSLLDIFVTLHLGACLVVPQGEALRDIAYVADLIARYDITVLHLVPSTLSTLLMLPDVSQWRALRHVPVGGEALLGSVADRFAAVFDAELRNHYGPTEAVVSATHLTVDGRQGPGYVPIGVPNRNVCAYVLDTRLQLVAPGVVGELYLGGRQLARGYLGRAGQTAGSFVADPFTPGARLYRTGDLARHNRNGELEFVGRADQQVKIRGFRVELGEVEAAIASHPGVAQCVVAAVADPAVGTMLAAYVVPESGAVDVDAIRNQVAGFLPSYMVPAAFAVVPAIPLTPHGKVDRAALPTAVRAAAAPFRAARTPIETRLVALYADLLGTEHIGADDSFFDLGGHSLLANRLVARIRSEFGVAIDVRAPFDSPTVAGLAALIEVASRRGARFEEYR